MIKVLRKSWQRIVAILLTTAILASPAILGIAAANTATATKVIAPPKVISVITGNGAEIYKNAVLKLATTQGISGKYQLDTNDVTVRDFDAAYNNGIIAASIPVIDNTGKKYSFYAALFKKDGTLVETIALIFSKVGSLYNATILRNNKEIGNVTMNENGTVVEGWRVDSSSGNKIDLKTSMFATPQAESFWGCMNSCLSGQGVPSWAIGAVGVLCFAVCEDIPNPYGCLACACAAIIAYSAQFAYCIPGCAKYA